LETPEQRIKLLKAGFSGKEIERLYIELNNFRIIYPPILYEISEFNGGNNTLNNLGERRRNSRCTYFSRDEQECSHDAGIYSKCKL